MNWIDSHNHLQFLPPEETAAAVAAMAAAGVERAVVNATSEADWEAVAALAGRWPERLVPAFGVHPWRAAEVAGGWQKRLSEVLERHPLASVGECGLDRRVAGQRAVFEAQLRLARELGRTVTIHCVQAWGELWEALDAVGTPGNFLMHGYGGSLEFARRLLPLGAYFSFSPILGGRALSVFKQLPRERLLVESDDRNPAALPTTGAVLAAALELTAEEVAGLTHANARTCFGW
ncbi:MAG: hypothetical protein RLZZ522_114 [Verrucomicrobiota bacterium]